MYDVLIIGGGLAGLTEAILLTKAGLKIALVEKKSYPFHKVCGEYFSNEVLSFMQEKLEVNPFDLGAVKISKFQLTSPKGRKLSLDLDLGGFGISRYTLDQALYTKAKYLGTDFYLDTQVTKINDDTVLTHTGAQIKAKIIIAAYGKRANLDSKLKRRFFYKRSPYIGVKYHIKYKQDDDLIALHNFKNGYCGISRIENGKYCLCYLTTRANLKKYKTIAHMEKEILCQNPFLQKIWQEAEFLFPKPEVINEISFASKTLIENQMLMSGDSAGMIAPLAGNGMSMAIHGGKVLSELLIDFFEQKISEKELYQLYPKQWKKLFGQRLWIGRKLQQFFGSVFLSEMLVLFFRNAKPLARQLIKKTHGKEF